MMIIPLIMILITNIIKILKKQNISIKKIIIILKNQFIPKVMYSAEAFWGNLSRKIRTNSFSAAAIIQSTSNWQCWTEWQSWKSERRKKNKWSKAKQNKRKQNKMKQYTTK